MADHDPESSAALAPMVRKLCYWWELDPADQAAVLTLPHTVRKMDPNAYLVREHDWAEHIFMLLSGFVFRHRVVATGQRQILGIHMPGEIVDLQHSVLGRADHNVQMLTAGRVACIPIKEVERITLERPNVARAVWTDTLVEGAILRRWVMNLGRRGAKARVAHFLCEFGLRHRFAGLGTRTEFHIPLTQHHLADATGLTPVYLNRTLQSLERDGLIERPSPKAVRISNWRGLAEAGDFDDSYLHLRAEEPGHGDRVAAPAAGLVGHNPQGSSVEGQLGGQH